MGIGETKLTSKSVPFLVGWFLLYVGVFWCVCFLVGFGFLKLSVFICLFLKKLKIRSNCNQDLDCTSFGPVYKCNPVHISSHTI